MSEPGGKDDTPEADDVLNRADALLNRHRAAAKTALNPKDPPTLNRKTTEELDLSAVPTLTDIVEAPSANAASAPAVDTNAGPAQGGEIISRVQAQNLEHGVYQKLKLGLDAHIAEVLQQRFMPEVAGALDQALKKIDAELKSNINAMV